MSTKKSGWLFVYGTLKQGQVRWYMIEDYVEAIKEGVVENAVMYDLGPFPALALNQAGRVVGELILVNDIDTVLAICDRIEGYREDRENPKDNLYNRVKVQIGDTEAWTYEFNNLNSLIRNEYPIVSKWERRERHAS